jgi:hypothetical protein
MLFRTVSVSFNSHKTPLVLAPYKENRTGKERNDCFPRSLWLARYKLLSCFTKQNRYMALHDVNVTSERHGSNST